MKNIITLISLSLFSFSCSQNYRSNYKYDCAKQLTENQIFEIQENSFKNYSKEDLDLLGDITTYIIDSNPEKEEYECFFNKREKDLLILDVFGLEDVTKIEKTFCDLVKNQKIKLPKKIIILFHKYINGFDDGGIIVGLTNK